MALFSISCTTCNARLSVRDEAVIGQILACPKCESMVLVEPPPDWRGPANATPPAHVAPKVETKTAGPADSTFDDAASLLSDESAASQPAEPASADVDQTVDQPIEVQLASEGAQATKPSEKAPEAVQPRTSPEQPAKPKKKRKSPPPIPKHDAPPEQPAAAKEAESEPLLPDGQWASSTSQRWRQMALVVGGAIAGLLLAVLTFGYFISRGSTDAPAIASTDGAGLADAAPVTPASRESNDDERENTDTNDDTAAAHDGSADADDSTSGDDRAPPPDAPSTDVATPPVTATDPGPDGTTDDGGPPPHKASLNPFELDPSPRTTPSADKGPEPESGAERVKDLAEELDEFAPFLDDAPFMAREAFGGPDKDKDAADEAPEAVEIEPVGDLRAPRPAPRNIDVDAQLAIPIADIEFPSILLIDYLRFLSQLSNVPITVDPDALAFLRVSPSKPIRVKLSDTTVRGAIEETLVGGLSYESRSGHLLIPDSRAKREIRYPMDDLAGDETSLASLRQTIADLIEPNVWQRVVVAEGETASRLAVEDGKLVVVAPSSLHYRILTFCEKLRIARDGRPLSRFPPELFDLATRRQQAAPKLAQPLTLNYGRETRLSDILARIEQETGLRILVDWQALETQGWNPDGLATLTADGQPLGEALSSMLLPLDLTWRAVDAGTVQVTTPDVLTSRAEIEFHPAGELIEDGDAAALLARIRTALGPHHFRDAGGVGALHLDVPSNCVIASLPQPQQNDLADLLRRWRAEK